MMNKYLLGLIAIVVLNISGCGGGSSSESSSTTGTPPASSTPEVYTGVFLDSAVEGLNYSTATQAGKTNAAGEFSYQIGEEITFSIGAIEFPAITASAIITPLDIFETNDINSTEVVNLLRLLQSLDIDGDPSNNIQISDEAHLFAQTLALGFSDETFEILVSELISMSGSINQQLVSIEQAVEHFQSTLNQISSENIGSCEKSHGMVGYSGFFETFHHNVAGKATIIDDCTIEITQFDYDGGGPDVFFYGALNHEYDGSSAFAIGQQLNGQVYNNAGITIKLPLNKTLDDLNGLSVWCVDFAANFGQMTFTP